MVQSAHRSVISEAMYLAMERAADDKHELRDGEVWSMAGASPRHNALAAACVAQLFDGLRDGPCRALGSDQRVHVRATGEYCYPDVTVVCGEPEYHSADPDSIVNPRLLVEVLSRSTERYDRGAKFEGYRSIESFEEYVLVWQDQIKVEVRRREGARRWVIDEYGAGDTVELRSVDATLDVDAMYEGVFALNGDERDAP